MCECYGSNGNGFGDIWWTDNPIYFSSIYVGNSVLNDGDLSASLKSARQVCCGYVILLLRSHVAITLCSLSIDLIDDISYVSNIMATRLFVNAVA